MQLIAYADRLGGDLSGLASLLDNEFSRLFDGVHILPFFDPIDGADAGFDPIDHTTVDPRIGDWSDIRHIGSRYSLMADLIVNHVSDASQQFMDVLENGERSRFWKMFLKQSDVFGSGCTDDIQRIYRPRPGAPFTRRALHDGREFDFWTTFSPQQIDINVECPEGRDYLSGILQRFADSGVREIRLDAAGYAIKRPGTSCFMLPETFDFIGQLTRQARSLGIQTLVEIHSHYRTQIAIAERVGRVYDFALPPLVLHTLYTGNSGALKRWLGISPRNCVTVLDTHDGIGILDVGPDGDKSGLLAEDEIDQLVETIHHKTRGESRKASGHAASNLDVYQINSTFYDALGQHDGDYLLARAIQFFCPGTPQVYYVGLLAGANDMALVDDTGVGRDINRHYYGENEIREAMKRPVVRSLFDLIHLRREARAFSGTFLMPKCDDHQLTLRWEQDSDSAQLTIDFVERTASITIRESDETRVYRVTSELSMIG